MTLSSVIYKNLDWIHFALQEALNENLDELPEAIRLVEEMRDDIKWEYTIIWRNDEEKENS